MSTTIHTEGIVAFKCQQWLINAPQCFVIWTLPPLL